MMIVLIIIGLLMVFIIGFIQVYKSHSMVVDKIDFAAEYRIKFVNFANKYFKTYDRWTHSGDLDGELYVWLTMNVSKIQNYVGDFGIMTYKPGFQNYFINNYQVIINTLPKFREGQVENFDVGAVDDCLLRYIGYLEEYSKDTRKNLINPIIWFREGFREILSIPIFVLSWFGVISRRAVNTIKDSLIYKFISGIISFVLLVSSIVTIVVGYDQTMEFITSLIKKYGN